MFTFPIILCPSIIQYIVSTGRCSRCLTFFHETAPPHKPYLFSFLLFQAPLLHGQENTLGSILLRSTTRRYWSKPERLIQAGDTAFNTFYLKALSEAQLGQTAEAIETLELALISHPEMPGYSGCWPDNLRCRRLCEGPEWLPSLVQTDSLDVSSWLKLAEIASFRQHDDQVIKALEPGTAHRLPQPDRPDDDG